MLKSRQAARVILLDKNGHVLLIRFVMPKGAGTMTFWATPGGGIEAGEMAPAAAARELREELGLTLALTGPVHTARGIFEYGGETVENTDTFFLARCDVTPLLSGIDAGERAALKELRWWSPDAIEASGEDIFPRDLAQVVRRLAKT